MEEEEEEDLEEPPMPTPFGDVPSLTYPLQGEPGGSLSATPPILESTFGKPTCHATSIGYN